MGTTSHAFRPDPELFPFESRWLESAVGRIHYIDEGAGRPILMLHGNPTWSFLYRGIVTALVDRFRCIAIDYPGFGLSDRPEGYAYTPAEHARVVIELVRDLELSDLVIMGQDWGGPIGIATALAQPERATGFVFGNTWFWPTDRWVNRLFSRCMSTSFMRRRILEDNFFVEKLIPMGTARTVPEAVMDHYRAVQPDPSARRGVAEFPHQLLAAADWLGSLAQQVPRQLADRPLLLVWGMRDFAFHPRHFLPRWRETFPDHRTEPLRNAKHFIQEDEPTAIAAAIRSRFG